MKDLVARLSSRKFLLAAGGALAFGLAGQFGEAAAVIVAFIGIEGTADVFARKAKAEIEGFQAERERQEV